MSPTSQVEAKGLAPQVHLAFDPSAAHHPLPPGL